MHCIIKTYRQKAWDDGLAPGVNGKESQWKSSNLPLHCIIAIKVLDITYLRAYAKIF